MIANRRLWTSSQGVKEKVGIAIGSDSVMENVEVWRGMAGEGMKVLETAWFAGVAARWTKKSLLGTEVGQDLVKNYRILLKKRLEQERSSGKMRSHSAP